MSVYKRGDKWAVRIDLERKDHGPRKRRYYGVFRTKAEARAKERAVLSNRATGFDLNAQLATVEQIVERYIANCETRGVGLNCIERYRSILKQQLNPFVGYITLEKLRKSHVAELITVLSKSGNVRSGGALSPKSIKHVVSLLATALQWAVEMEIIQHNPASRMRLPKIGKRTAKAIDAEEARRLLQAAEAEGYLWSRLFTVSLTVGARRGEVAALKMDDVDWDAGTVTISRALSKTVTAGVIVKPTKTGNVRTVKLSPMALAALRAQRAAVAAERLKAGDYQDNGWLFAGPLGATLNPASITNAFKRIAVAAKISTTRLHDMRHTFASWLLASGENVETVRDALGHSTSYTTLTVYGHAIKKATHAAVESIDRKLQDQGHQMATVDKLAV